MILVNFNLPPEVRTQLHYIIPLGVIPGPHAPKDFNSFEWPFVRDCKILARGVRLLGARDEKIFTFHAYPTHVMGDM
ncbi:hypothetical protein DL93DRAFT_2042152, partial [Clavulina sp. PMI_390]